jgi:hypothetical protein
MDAQTMILQLQALKANAHAQVAAIDALMSQFVQKQAATPAEPQPCQHRTFDNFSTNGKPRINCRDACKRTIEGNEAARVLGWPIPATSKEGQ